MTVLEIIDEGEAKVWMAEVERLNQDTQKLLTEVGQALQQVRDDADSTIVDELYDWGTRMITASTEIFKGMTELYNAVDSIVKKVSDVIENGLGTVKNIIKGIASI